MNYSISSIPDEPLGRTRARHLLNRSVYGPLRSEIDSFAGMTISQALDTLLSAEPEPGPPLHVYGEDPDVPFGTSWVDAPLNGTLRAKRKKSLRAWMVSQIMNQGSTLREKMVMFWHNHFVTEINVVGIPAYFYDYYQLLLKHSLGNYKSLTGEMTINTGMLRYLDGIRNTSGSPNENYSRELFELFTIGKGPLIADGDYTHYTENDVQEGARVLTGWKVNNNTLSSYFDSSKHDRGSKTFSGFYEGHTISDQGDQEYLALVNMILSKKETARHLVRKIYRWFVYYDINEDVENNIIEALTDTFYNGGYELAPVLRQLLSSEHFYDPSLRGCYIKNPAEFTLGLLRTMEVALPEDLFTRYEFWLMLQWRMLEQELDLGTPPDVAGWPAYYLEPQFNQLWVNSATLPVKSLFINKILNSGYTKNNVKLLADVIAVAELTSDPSDINVLVPELCELFLPIDAGQETIDELKEVLIPGLPDFEWRIEWDNYKADPGNDSKKKAVENALKDMLEALLQLPEFQVI